MPNFERWGLHPQNPIGLRRLGAKPPDPQNSPPLLRISGYAPAGAYSIDRTHRLLLKVLESDVGKVVSVFLFQKLKKL